MNESLGATQIAGMGGCLETIPCDSRLVPITVEISHFTRNRMVTSVIAFPEKAGRRQVDFFILLVTLLLFAR